MSTREGNNVLTGGTGAPDGSMAAGWSGPRGDVMRDEFGLDIPVENVPLPSKGVMGAPASNFLSIFEFSEFASLPI